MSEKLAAKHTNSLALTKHKLLQQESGTKSYCCPCTRPHKLALFCIVSCCIFLLYWIVITPLLISHPDVLGPKPWSNVWFIAYWIGAFLIWLFIMVCLVLLWRCYGPKHSEDVKLQKYGTNGTPKSVSFNEDVKLDIKQEDGRLSSESTVEKKDISNDKVKKHRDLPPLVIHRRNLGNDAECAGSVNIEEDDGDVQSKRGSQKEQRESMKSYLKLVTVTPQDETDKTPKALLSPRELFFIDLIREAEKAEQNKGANVERKHFFPNDFLEKERDAISREKAEPSTSEQREATYFIADVESPRSEKAEVYLEIQPEPEVKEWSVNLNKEKPVLQLKNDAKDENTEKKVVLFEV
nr:PREDICTED: uncharacterized protein LOC105662994 [Megachile rotundata]